MSDRIVAYIRPNRPIARSLERTGRNRHLIGLPVNRTGSKAMPPGGRQSVSIEEENMRVRTFALALLASVISTSALFAQVQGSEVVDKASTFQDALVEVVVYPMTQGEIDYLLDNVGPIVSWAEANPEMWDAVDDADETLPAIRSLDVWDATGVSMSPFIAILLKAQIAHQVKTQGFTAEQLNSQIEQAEQMMDSGVIPAEQMA
jgi:hypothetical protein